MESTVYKKFSSTFVVDAPKISRLAKLVTDHFEDIDGAAIIKYTFSTKNGKNFTANRIDDVLAHDNPVKNPIHNLEIEAYDKMEDPSNHCKIEYNKEDDKIKIFVGSNDGKKSNELFDEIEEQVNRCLIKDKIYFFKKSIIVLFFVSIMALLIFSATYYAGLSDYALTDKLSSEDIYELEPKFNNAKTQEEKIDAIFQFNKRIINNNTSDKDFNYYVELAQRYFYSVNTYLIAIPVVLVLILIKILIGTYVGSVFLWGDYKDYYEKILEKRKNLINILIGSISASVIVNIFFIGLGN
ncbi:MAG: hypothetical protein CV087_09445 [Candidatus Brocadia sp. WS118]|nr:MAG: hypothetical protein CV087_09445 [Candidatus Brocadia sp. WS118]